MHKVWIEVALNGAWSCRLQPGIPDTVEAIVAEGIACARAGACDRAHARLPRTASTPSTGRSMPASSRASAPRSTCRSIRPIRRSTTPACDGRQRFAHVEALAERGLLEFAVVDPGSVNFTTRDHHGRREARLHLSQSRSACAPCARPSRPQGPPPGLRDLRARLHAGRRRARACRRRQDADLPLHVLRDLRLRLPAQAVRARGASRAAGGRDATAPWMIAGLAGRCPAADRRDGGARRPCARRPGGCAVGHADGQSRLGRGGGAAGARGWRRARNGGRYARGARRRQSGRHEVSRRTHSSSLRQRGEVSATYADGGVDEHRVALP